MRCNICEKEAGGDVERASVRSNVRKFRQEAFEVWRCPHCRSIHAAEEVDLTRYYADYPFHRLADTGVDWMLGAMYRNLLKRLRANGFERSSSLLDFGCGSGHFLTLLKRKGYEHVAGFDEYSKHYRDRAVLTRRYDVVMSQDVIEHVESPRKHLGTLAGLVEPGGLVVVGTPNAEAIDLARPLARVHTLHQPYHRHILAAEALRAMGRGMGWELARYYPTMYSNTRIPFVNTPFVNHYFSCFDDTVDLALEPIKVGSWKLWSVASVWYALVGSYVAPETDVMAIFRTPGVKSEPADHRSDIETH